MSRADCTAAAVYISATPLSALHQAGLEDVRAIGPVVAGVVSDLQAGTNVDPELAAQIEKTRKKIAAQRAAEQAAGTVKPRPVQLEPRLPMLHAVSAAHVLTRPAEPMRWRVEGLLPEVGLVLHYGEPKRAMKSWTTMAWCVAVAAGKPWAGLPTVQAPAIYVAGEGPRSMWEARLRALCGGAPPPDGMYMVEPPCGLRLDVGSSRAELCATIKHYKAGLVVLDPFSALHRTNEDLASKIGPVARRVAAIAEATACCVVMVHHDPKPREGRRQSPRGSGELAASADQLIGVSRRGAEIRLDADGRYGPAVQVRVRPTIAGGTVVGFEAVGAGENADEDDLVALITEYVAENPGTTRDGVAAGIGRQRKAVGQAVRELRDAGGIVLDGKGLYLPGSAP